MQQKTAQKNKDGTEKKQQNFKRNIYLKRADKVECFFIKYTVTERERGIGLSLFLFFAIGNNNFCKVNETFALKFVSSIDFETETDFYIISIHEILVFIEYYSKYLRFSKARVFL